MLNQRKRVKPAKAIRPHVIARFLRLHKRNMYPCVGSEGTETDIRLMFPKAALFTLVCNIGCVFCLTINKSMSLKNEWM